MTSTLSAEALRAFMYDGVMPPAAGKKLSCGFDQQTQQAPKVATTRSRFTKKFEGDDWKDVLAAAPELLRQTFVSEACAALNVPERAIDAVEFRLGSLYVTFHVTHDEDITQEEMEQRIEEYPFREMWRLYGQRDAAPDGLDAALAKIKDLEAELAQKNRDLDKLGGNTAQRIGELERQLDDTRRELEEKAADRERELLAELAKEQAARKQADAKLKDFDEQIKKLTENLKKEKNRFDKTAQRQNELIAAIIQENKKEKEAKEREYNEALDVKDYIIESLKEQLRSLAENGALPGSSVTHDQSEEFNKLMGRMEEIALVLQRTQESDAEARAEITRLNDVLRQSEEARHAESITFENDMLALRQQLAAYQNTKLAEDHAKRAEENRSSRRGTANVAAEVKENETIVRQYETALENIVGTLQDRLSVLREEFQSYLSMTQESMAKEHDLLVEHEEDSNSIRETFRTSSLALQKIKIFCGQGEEGVSQVVEELDQGASGVEKSIAAVKMATVMLQTRSNVTEQREWMESHQRTMEELIGSLRALNKRAFQRQLSLMNTTSTGAAGTK